MANLTVWKFSKPDGASQTLRTLKELQDEGLIVLHDAAIVEWPEGRNKPATRQLQDLVGPGALHGAFWGLLFGLLFFVPFLVWRLGRPAAHWLARFETSASTTISSSRSKAQ